MKLPIRIEFFQRCSQSFRTSAGADGMTGKIFSPWNAFSFRYWNHLFLIPGVKIWAETAALKSL